MSERDRPGETEMDDEIEITDEMIEAGVRAKTGPPHKIACESDDPLVCDIYEAMVRASLPFLSRLTGRRNK